jgi:hypothetical protein
MTLTFEELRAKLGKTKAQLTALVRQGLPVEGRGRQRRFDPVKVRDWLVAKGLAVVEPTAKAAPRIARTRQEAANAIGVNIRTFATWLSDPTFPGKAGGPGRQDGFFPIEEIAEWWMGKQGLPTSPVPAGPESQRERGIRIRNEQEELELKRMKGELADVVDVERLMRRQIAIAKTVLRPLPEQLLLELPAEPPTDAQQWAEMRQRHRLRVQTVLRDCFAAIAEMLSKESDDEPVEDGE